MRYNISGTVYNDIKDQYSVLENKIFEFHFLATQTHNAVEFMDKLRKEQEINDLTKSVIRYHLQRFITESMMITGKIADTTILVGDIILRFRALTFMNPWLNPKPVIPEFEKVINYVKTSEEIAIDRGLTFSLGVEKDIKEIVVAQDHINMRYTNVLKDMPFRNEDEFKVYCGRNG